VSSESAVPGQIFSDFLVERSEWVSIIESGRADDGFVLS